MMMTAGSLAEVPETVGELGVDGSADRRDGEMRVTDRWACGETTFE